MELSSFDTVAGGCTIVHVLCSTVGRIYEGTHISVLSAYYNIAFGQILNDKAVIFQAAIIVYLSECGEHSLGATVRCSMCVY